MNLSSALMTSAALAGVMLANPAAAQVDDPSIAETTPAPDTHEIGFAADQLDYDQEKDIVTASGNVRMERDGNHVRADQIIWDRRTGEVRAEGSVIVDGAEGDRAFGEQVVLKESLRDGIVENLLIVLNNGGRLVADRATRTDGISKLDRAVYSPCRVIDDKGCPKEPVWKITAVRVTHDPRRNRISYRDARLELFGLPVLALPGLSHPADDRGGTGFLIPNIQYLRNTGLEIATPFYLALDTNRDLTITPHIYTAVAPLLELEYRHLTRGGAYRLAGFGTYGERVSTSTPGQAAQNDFRGYFEGGGRFQLDRRWSVTSAFRFASDRTFLRRYDVSRDDRLRSTANVERITRSSYLSISGWAFQTLRSGEVQGQFPFALPAIDWRKRLADPWAGGQFEFQLNSMALLRSTGQDTQRAFAGARWDLQGITPLGQELKFTAYGRTDVYHTDEVNLTSTADYRGENGWNTRAIAAFATEMRWPLVGAFLNGQQRLTPRLQLVASPGTSNLRVPNEDARAVDLEDSNLFALNRFPGYDRWEDSTRLTYGADWTWSGTDLRIDTNIGQSFRVSATNRVFPDGTGLFGRTSDIVGRTNVRFKNTLNFTHRYRLDKDNLAVRRNEIDASIGNNRTYASIGYLRLNRDIGPQLEDLRDREEVRLGGRLQFARYWSLFGSTTIDLTGRQEDPTSLANGYEPVRHRLGIAYEDDCLTFGVTWRRDYDAQGDARRGNTFQLRLSFRNLGR